jgi:hypothetical protein
MQDRFAEKDFFDWLRAVSRDYGNAMAEWSRRIQSEAAGADTNGVLLSATDAAIDRLVALLMAIGHRHDDRETPREGHAVLDALDRLIGASADLLREARGLLESYGTAALSQLATRIGGLRELEAEVESASLRLGGQIRDTYGEPETP